MNPTPLQPNGTVLHLLPAAEWASAGDPHRPASLATEGFVHCTGDVDTLLGVANRFYRSADGEMSVLVIDPELVGAPVRWEAPAHPDGRPPSDDEPRFPHVYGPIPHASVVAVWTMQRLDDGRYTGVRA